MLIDTWICLKGIYSRDVMINTIVKIVKVIYTLEEETSYVGITNIYMDTVIHSNLLLYNSDQVGIGIVY